MTVSTEITEAARLRMRLAAIHRNALTAAAEFELLGELSMAEFARAVARVAEVDEPAEAPAPAPVVAWVSVDDDGRVMPESTVTVGDETWPVPERTPQAGVAAPVRIGVALRERGWRQVRGAEHDTSRLGLVGIPVERVSGT